MSVVRSLHIQLTSDIPYVRCYLLSHHMQNSCVPLSLTSHMACFRYSSIYACMIVLIKRQFHQDIK